MMMIDDVLSLTNDLIETRRFWEPSGSTVLAAVTGGIGSGKSVLASLLQDMGATVVDADVIAREMMAPGMPLTKAIIAEFGSTIDDGAGGINRQELSKIVFSVPADRQRLNMLTHPVIQEEALHRINAATTPLVIYDVPLLFESGAHLAVDVVIVVTAPLKARIARVMKRSGLSEEQVKQRISAQHDDADLIAQADIVVRNDCGLDQLHAAATDLYNLLIAKVKS